MLIFSLCPHCQAEHELSKKLIGEEILCQKCNQPFKVKEATKKEEKIGLQSSFDRQRRQEESETSKKARFRVQDGKLSLVVPPPPREHWSAKKDRTEPEPRFKEFRQNSKAVKCFLEREDVSDYSGLLVVGLIASTLLVMAFLGFLIYLIVK